MVGKEIRHTSSSTPSTLYIACCCFTSSSAICRLDTLDSGDGLVQKRAGRYPCPMCPITVVITGEHVTNVSLTYIAERDGDIMTSALLNRAHDCVRACATGNSNSVSIEKLRWRVPRSVSALSVSGRYSSAHARTISRSRNRQNGSHSVTRQSDCGIIFESSVSDSAPICGNLG